jgi:UDP-N-acetylglucosamine 1-carboxyvinyltransferase
MGGVGKGLPTRVEHTDGMDRVLVRPNGPLTGEVAISGAKNSALLLMAATLLAPGEHVLTNVPRIADVATMVELLGAIGVECEREGTTIALRTPDELHPEAPYHLVERMPRRSACSVRCSRCGERSGAPGGDDFGSRPIDMHLSGLEALGATFELERVRAGLGGRLEGRAVTLEFPSVGATENILMAAALAKGTTVLDNAAREPEISDLADLLNAMGAHIEGAGTSTIEVEGVDELHAAKHETIPDRVEAATYLAAVAITFAQYAIRRPRADHMEMYIRKLTDMGVTVTSDARRHLGMDRSA